MKSVVAEALLLSLMVTPAGFAKPAKKSKSPKPEQPVYTAEMAKKVVDEAESLRAFGSASSKVRVMTKEPGGKTTYFMDVLQSSDRRAYLEFTAPAEEVGRRMLAIKTNYWTKFPDSSRVISISRREAIGNSAFAIADVFQMDTEGDYNSEIIGEEKVKGIDCYQVELKAKHNDAPYHRIVYLVKKSDSYPVKAKFYGASGKHLKTMTILKDDNLAGKVRPKVLHMKDEVTKGKLSIWTTLSVKEQSVPDNVFTKAYLKGR